MPIRQTTQTSREVLAQRLRRPLDPRVRHIRIESRVLGVPKSFFVGLPPGYFRVANAGRRYPTLYLFRGHEREWIHRQQDVSRHDHTVIDVYRDLLSEGKVGPMILVFPGISSDDNRVPGMLVNFREPKLVSGAPGIGTGRFEDYFIQELMPYVDSHFRTDSSRNARAVDGFSLGGFQSIKIAAQYPHLFRSAGSFDGTFLYSNDRGKSVRKTDRVLRNPIFAPAFGAERDYEYIAANNPSNLLWRADRTDIAHIQWMLRSGPETAEPWQSNYFRNRHVVDILKQQGIENAIDPVFPLARHNWHWADNHIESTLPLHWHAVRSSEP
ncbi:MAG TPA: alpha/beta hydrolase-fold protein [Chloroflexia bacterium]|nr:alpha/beta hydrolase-fold protein [Chloroflexia bacterium]